MKKKSLWLIILVLVNLILEAGCGHENGNRDIAMEKQDQNDGRENPKEDIDIRNTEKDPNSAEGEMQQDISSFDILDDDGWKKAYFQYMVKENLLGEQWSYSFIYVNDDLVPELVANSGVEAGGCVVMTYKDGKVDAFQTARLDMYYIEKSNIINNSAGHMGYYYDRIYKIVNGKWVNIVNGEYSGFENEANPERDAETGRLLCKDYVWDGKIVTKDEYNASLKRIYNEDNAVSPQIYFSLNEMVSFLESGDSSAHRYELIKEDCTWSEAQSLCEEKGGYLAVISSEEEFQKITAQIVTENKENIIFWLGTVTNYSEKTHWLEGEPSYYTILDNGEHVIEGCPTLFYRKAENEFYLNDVSFDVISVAPYYAGNLGYVCEYDQ